MKIEYNFNTIKHISFILIVSVVFCFNQTNAQYKNAWMSVGSFNNWYSEIGSELEEAGFIKTQQDGMQWPAIHPYQDMQAAKGMWIGATNFTDEKGDFYPFKVITCGPRAPAFYALYPQKFEMLSKFTPTAVSVDGNLSYRKNVDIDQIDPNLIADRMLDNVINTQLGITIERKIFQFGQQYNDNYIVMDYTFTNTGNVNADDNIELPNQTLTGVYFYFNYRLAVSKQADYVIGNSTRWGKNTMNDARGDGVANSTGDPDDQKFRAQFSWHGWTNEKDVPYDNIGGPIQAIPASSAIRAFFPDLSDTVGRLGASQFVGVVTLHADKSASDTSDDFSQPSTTAYESSDQGLFLAGANAFNSDMMTQEYALMSKGHMSPRHALAVEPSGDYALQRTPPNLGTSGGLSFSNGYGPYDLAPGQSVHIIMAEGASGISREEQARVGRLYKRKAISDEAKDRVVMQGRDSLFQTFRRAIANYQSGYKLPMPPQPPSTFDVSSGGDRISLAWTVDPTDPTPITGFRIYRAQAFVDSSYKLIYEAGPSDRSYDDLSPIRGVDYYYYIVAVGENQPGGPGTPAGKLVSDRYYTQTYDPARLQRKAGTSLSQIRIVPNPFNISSGQNSVRFPDDRIAFYNIPGQCTIKIYTELGELIKTIEHTNGSGDEFWYQVTSSNQIVVSGIYIAVITDTKTGEKHIAKFAVIR